jgi:hypothetical protein
MKDANAWPWPAGFDVLRVLSEGEGGIVALVSKASGELVALKLLRLAPDILPDEALARHQLLSRLTGQAGLLPIRNCGLTTDRAWLWEELELVDSLDGSPPSARDDYQPVTLRAELIERGPLATAAAVAVGVSVCASLNVLHSHGLVHRDVKPGNLFRLRGEVVLGDYGLTAPPGAPFDFKGTEGFVPSEGTADAAADLFALSKTLYELWTGCDRLEFPTLPKRVLDAPDWPKQGAAFNALLLRICSPRAQERHHSAIKLTADLQAIAAGQSRRITRRHWLAASAALGLGAGVTGVGLLVTRKTPVARWRQRSGWSYIPVEWTEQQPLLDEQRNCLFHLQCRRGEAVLGRLDLVTFDYQKSPIEEVTHNSFSPILHPEERTIWFAEGGLGTVWRLHPDSGEFTKLPGVGVPEGDTSRDFDNLSYWNPISRRFGCFGGYGQFAVHNWRWESDAAKGEWLNVETNQPGREPRGRSGGRMMPLGDEPRVLLFGGHGNLTGKRDVRDPNTPLFDGRFHRLGDLWSLDLTTDQWSCLVPAPGLTLPNPWSACYLRHDRVVFVVQARANDQPFGTPANVFVHRVGKDQGFISVTCRGDVPDGNSPGYITALPSGRSLLAFQKAGIFELTLEV